jgi:endonuclease/exonuclease/phosphatase family metal-dependent hydrolase
MESGTIPPPVLQSPVNRRSFLIGLSAVGAGCRVISQAGGPSLTFLTYNLHHGEGTDGRIDLDRIGGIIREARPDLVALQEVDHKAQRTRFVDQPSEYARLTGMHAYFGAAMPFEGGEYGQVLLSRWPLTEARVIHLPGNAAREPRIAATARTAVPGLGAVRWGSVHLDATQSDEDRWEQVGALLQEFDDPQNPTLLAGDFNATPDSRVMRRMLEHPDRWTDTAVGTPAPTIPAAEPKARIEYILASPAASWRVIESRVLAETVASDHRPLVATLRWLGDVTP